MHNSVIVLVLLKQIIRISTSLYFFTYNFVRLPNKTIIATNSLAYFLPHINRYPPYLLSSLCFIPSDINLPTLNLVDGNPFNSP